MVRKFGKIVVKPSKANPKWIEASYLTPVAAFSEWPDLPNRQTATFPCTQDGRDEAAAWLTRARRRIEADVWEPERIVKRKAKDTALTFGEYAAKWLETREGEGLHANTIYGIRCTVKRLIDAFGGMPIGKITSADIERYAATLPKDHPYVGRELLSKLRQILDAAATPDQDGIAVIAKSPFAMQVRKPAPREETPAATPRQLRRIHDAMPRKFQLAITLAISCGGLRIGEVCALQRGDIDLDNRLIHIRRTRLTRARVIAGPPKTASVVIDAQSPAMSLLPELKAAHVKVTVTNMQEMGRACGRFLDMLKAGTLKHPRDEYQPQLAAAVKGATTRPLGQSGAIAWNKLGSDIDITPLVSTTIALYGACTTKRHPGRRQTIGGI